MTSLSLGIRTLETDVVPTMIKHMMNVWREVWNAKCIELVESPGTKEAKQTR